MYSAEIPLYNVASTPNLNQVLLESKFQCTFLKAQISSLLFLLCSIMRTFKCLGERVD